ncbi:hypothetical protein ACUSIJ_02540 [Pseudochelatococcus sp. B33]
MFAAVLRRITGNRPRLGYASSSARHRQQRLGVIDAVDIDAHRQLLLLRRDNVEHLVLIGGPNDLLVESGIGRLPYRAPIQAQQPAPVEDFVPGPARLDPPAPPQAGAAAAAGLAGAAGVAAGTGLDSLSPSEPAPIRSPLTPPPPPPSRPLATPVAPKPAAADDVKDDAADLPAPPAAGEKDAPEPPPAREPAKGPFSAVARQLEEALRRPFAAVRPSPVTGIDLDESTPPAAQSPAQSPAKSPVAKSPVVKPPVEPVLGEDGDKAKAAAEEVRAPVPPAPPVQATLPIPPREEGRFAGKSGDAPFPAVRRDSGPSAEAPPAADVKPAEKPASEPAPVFEPQAPVPPPVSPAPPPPAGRADTAGSSATPASSADEVEPDDKPASRVAEILPPEILPRRATPFGAPIPPGPASLTPASPTPASPPPASPSYTPGGTRILGPGEAEATDTPDTLKVPETLKASPEAARSQPAPKETFDLSSLENIEAEFARLLGRTSPGKDK